MSLDHRPFSLVGVLYHGPESVLVSAASCQAPKGAIGAQRQDGRRSPTTTPTVNTRQPTGVIEFSPTWELHRPRSRREEHGRQRLSVAGPEPGRRRRRHRRTCVNQPKNAWPSFRVGRTDLNADAVGYSAMTKVNDRTDHPAGTAPGNRVGERPSTASAMSRSCAGKGNAATLARMVVVSDRGAGRTP
jgi:hypothetical protein